MVRMARSPSTRRRASRTPRARAFSDRNADGTYKFLGTANFYDAAGVSLTNGSDGTFSFDTATSITNTTGTGFFRSQRGWHLQIPRYGELLRRRGREPDQWFGWHVLLRHGDEHHEHHGHGLFQIATRMAPTNSSVRRTSTTPRA